MSGGTFVSKCTLVAELPRHTVHTLIFCSIKGLEPAARRSVESLVERLCGRNSQEERGGVPPKGYTLATELDLHQIERPGNLLIFAATLVIQVFYVCISR